MEGSSPKRRRISPHSSDEDAPSEALSPLPPRTEAPPRRKSPSFESPTRSPTARFRRQVLERRASQSPSQSPSRNTIYDQNTTAAEKNSHNPLDSPTITRTEKRAHGSGSDSVQRAGMGAAPRRSLSRPNPRPLPRSEPDDEEFDPFMGRQLPRFPNTGLSIQQVPEPELPPSVPDPISSTPPRGIHTSSPSRWKGKGKLKGNSQPITSSPLKRPPNRPGSDQDETPVLFMNKKPQKGTTAKSKSRETDTYVRKVVPYDPLEGKKKERDKLKDDLDKLKQDLKIMERENERVRIMVSSGRVATLSDEDAALNIVRRYLLPDHEEPPRQSQTLAKAALDPFAFMSLGTTTITTYDAQGHEEDQEDFSNIRSHYPIAMTAAQELPYLQLFSPFSITSTMTALPRQPGEPLQQLLALSLQSRHTPGIFNSRLHLTIDPQRQIITSLSISSLEPAARAELSPFVDKICGGDCNRSMRKNCGIVVWAMGEWLRVAEDRAQLWSQLWVETEAGKVRLDRSRNARIRRRKTGEKEGGTTTTGGGEGGPEGSCGKTDLLRFLGQQTLDLSVPSAKGVGNASNLRLVWKIGFDWTGEAQSKVSVMTGVPGKWHKVDSKGALGKIPDLFKGLVEGGVKMSEAVVKVVALLAGQE